MASKKQENPNRKTKSKKLPPVKKYRLILTLPFLASVLFIFLAFNYLPVYYSIAAGLLLSLLIVCFSQMVFSRKSRTSRFFGRFLCLVLSGVLFVGSAFIFRGNSALNKITGSDVETVSVSVAVLKDSPAQSLEDVKDGLFAYNESFDEEIIEDAAAEIEKVTKTAPELDNYTQYTYLVDGLYNGKADAIIFNEAYRPWIEDSHSDFEERTRILTTFSLEYEEEPASTAVSDVTRDCFIAYISGIDIRGEVTAKSRSDANMLVVVNPNTHQILLLGIPRDYYVTFHSTGTMDKLTHSGLYGVNETIATLEDLLGISINYYARLNFTAAVNIIDAVDGIDVYSPIAFTTVGDKYDIAEGTNHLNGDQALYFMRSRKMLPGGDNDRVSNQIRVIKALLKKVMSFSSITNFNKVLEATELSVQTNMTEKEVQSLIQMQLKSMPEWDIQNYQLSGSNLYTTEAAMSKGTRTYVMEVNLESVQEAMDLIESMLNNETIDLEKIE